MTEWKACKNILCIRADNMGDVIMSGPAIRALRNFTKAKITLLTSRKGNLISPSLDEIDATLVYDLPWSGNDAPADADSMSRLIEILRSCHFDAAVIFTVYSQSALPAALTCLLSGIPKRLAYCRENPYQLLTDWVPDQEPYRKINHQVQRDLELVAAIGAGSKEDRLSLLCSPSAVQKMKSKLSKRGITSEHWIVAHPGVSEEKRMYPVALWKQTLKALQQKFKMPVLVTGSAAEKKLTDELGDNDSQLFSMAGTFSIEEFIALIGQAHLVVAVNTSAVHIAAAQQTPVVVLYAMTNPQHTPWKVKSEVLYFNEREELKSKNEVIRYVSDRYKNTPMDYPTPDKIIAAAERLLSSASVQSDFDGPADSTVTFSAGSSTL